MRFSTFDASAARRSEKNPHRTVPLNGFQTTRCRLQAKIITRNLEIFGDVSARNIEPEPVSNSADRRQYRPPGGVGAVENAGSRVPIGHHCRKKFTGSAKRMDIECFSSVK
ncbi:hypothetical protein ACV229_33580 [Burkholderia sp. MR1-5-21]